MHEYSIVQSIIDSCDKHAKENKANKVTKVMVKIGVLSGVEPYLLAEAFDMFKLDTVCHSAEFLMNIQKIKVHCKTCENEQELEENEFICPKCASYELYVLDGEDMYLMSLELE